MSYDEWWEDVNTSYTKYNQLVRERNLKWKRRYLDIAMAVASWSKDPRRQIGCVIVGDNGEIVAQGYNGFPRGVKDTEERYNDRETKHRFVVHAEINAILNAARNGTRVEGATMYVYGLPPCCDCTKAIIQSGISNVIIKIDDNEEMSSMWKESFDISKQMLKESKIKYEFVD